MRVPAISARKEAPKAARKAKGGSPRRAAAKAASEEPAPRTAAAKGSRSIAPESDAAMPSIVLRDKATIDLVQRFALNKAKADRAEEENLALKDQIMKAMGKNLVASCGAHVVRITKTAGTPSKPNVTITKDMIGVVIIGSKGRAPSTRLEVI